MYWGNLDPYRIWVKTSTIPLQGYYCWRTTDSVSVLIHYHCVYCNNGLHLWENVSLLECVSPAAGLFTAKLGSSGLSRLGGALVEPSGLDLLLREFSACLKVRHVILVDWVGVLWSLVMVVTLRSPRNSGLITLQQKKCHCFQLFIRKIHYAAVIPPPSG